MRIICKRHSRILAGALALTLMCTLLPLDMLLVKAATTTTVTIENDKSYYCEDAANLVKNGSFENGTNDWATDFFSGKPYVSVSDEEAKTGTHSLKFQGTGEWNATGQSYTLEENTEYTFSMWIKGESTGNATFGLQDRVDADRKYIGGEARNFQYTNNWYLVSFSFNSGSCTTVMFRINNGTGTAYMDDIRLFKKTDGVTITGTTATITSGNQRQYVCAEEDNLSKNSGFENGLTSWNFNHTDVLSVTDETAKTGTYSLKFSSETADWNHCPQHIVQTDLKPNTEYTFSVFVKGTEKGNTLLALMDRSGFVNEAIGGDSYKKTFIYDNAWRRVSFSFNTGQFCSNVRIYIGNGGGTVYFDDFRLFESSKATAVPTTAHGSVVYPQRNGSCNDEDNLIPNFSFEEDVTQRCALTTNYPSVFSVSTEEAYTGSKSLKFSSETVNWDSYYQPFPDLKPNTDYTFSVWVKGTVSGNTVFALEDSSSGVGPYPVVGTQEIKDNKFHATYDGEWHRISLSFNSGTCNQVSLYVGNGAGTLYFDDFRLFETAKALPEYIAPDSVTSDNSKATCEPSDNVIPDNSLENNGDLWNGFVAAYPSLLSISGDLAKTGNKSLKLSGSVSGVETLDLTLPSVTAGTQYTFSMWTKGMPTSSEGEISVMLMDMKGNSIVADTQQDGFTVSKDGIWHQITLTFNTQSCTQLQLLLTFEGGVAYFDDFYLFPSDKYAAVADRNMPIITLWSNNVPMDPASPEHNLIVTGDFESEPAEGTSWNVHGFIGSDAVTLDDHGNAYEGKTCLKFSSNTPQIPQSAVMWIDVEPDTSYVLSTWVKGEPISEDNRADLTFGILDPVTKEFLLATKQLYGSAYSYDEEVNISRSRNMTPPAWDGNWYQRGYVFNTGDCQKVGIALVGSQSVCYFDNMVLCKRSDAMSSEVFLQDVFVTEENPALRGCADKDNMFEDYDFTDSNSAYWKNGLGYGDTVTLSKDNNKNGVLSYCSAEVPTWASYIRWVKIKPNTEYTFSVYVKSPEDCETVFGLMDSDPHGFKTIGQELKAVGDGNWHILSYSFYSADYEDIAFFISDGGGSIEFDNIRLFEANKGIKLDDPLPDSNPDTGSHNKIWMPVWVMLVVCSGIVTFGLSYRRRRTR